MERLRHRGGVAEPYRSKSAGAAPGRESRRRHGAGSGPRWTHSSPGVSSKPARGKTPARFVPVLARLSKIHSCNKHRIGTALPDREGHSQQKGAFLEQPEAARNADTDRVLRIGRLPLIPNGAGIVENPHNVIPIGDGPVNHPVSAEG